MCNIRVDILAPWKLINEEDAVLIANNRDENFSSRFSTRNFFGQGGVSRYAATPFIVALFPRHSDTTRFRYGHQSRQEVIWIAPKSLQILFRLLAHLTFLIRLQAFPNPLRGELPHVQIFINDGPNPLIRAAQLFSCLFS